MSDPTPLELLSIDHLLSQEEREIQRTVRRVVDDVIRPTIIAGWNEGRLSQLVIRQLGDLGVLGMHLNGYGCAGVNAVSYGLACMELEAGDSSVRSLVSVQGSLAMFAIHRWGSEEQKQRWLPRMATGEIIGCFGLTEPEAGSNPATLRVSARLVGDIWILNGTKMWITNGSIADIAIVWARTEQGIRGFIVPTETSGFTALDVQNKLSLRASVTSELILNEVHLSADCLLPGSTSLRGPLACLDEARYGIAWGVLGAARDCLETAITYAQNRLSFGQPVAAFQLTQSKLVDMALELHKAFLLALHLGRMKDNGRLESTQVSLGKLNNVREALEIARTSRTILGANGITLDYPIMRHAMNLESVLTYEGTSEIHTLIIGKALTGLSAFA